jgi:hypothetical protein
MLLGTLLVVPLLVLPGCGSGGAVLQYNIDANKILADVNTREGELKKYWTMSLAEQEGEGQALAAFRKSLSASQEVLDSTDSPDPSRKLDDLLGQAVDQGRELADLDTQFADYLGSIAPLTKGAADIITMLQGLDKVQYVPSSIAALSEKVRNLEIQARSIQPPANFNDVHAELESFLALEVAQLAEAQKKLANVSSGTTSNRDDNGDTSPASTAQDAESQRQTKRQLAAIEPYTETILEAWGQLNETANAMLEEQRQATGLTAKAAEVENYIGQAVQQIQILQKQYK